MGTQLDTWQLVEAPAAVPQPYGIFSVAEPRLTTDDHWRLGVQWQSQACGDVYTTSGPCIDPEVAGLTPDDVCSVSQYEPFTVYSYSTDPIPGYTVEEHRAHAIARLTLGEQKAVEAELWSRMSTAVPAPVSTTAYSPEFALGWLENMIATNYNGQGIIHMNKVAATVFSDTLVYPEGSRLRTNLGTPVVISASYDPQPATPVSTSAVIFATGPVVIYRGDIDTREDAIDKARNQVSIVAQRDYVIGWDCTAVGITASLSTVVV